MSSFPFRALIFDLDGTLADSIADLADAMNLTLGRHGLPVHPLEAFKTMVGEGIDVLVRRALPAGYPGDVKAFADEYRAAYKAADHAKTQAYPGIAAMLDGVTALGVPMAVLSNKRDDFTRRLVEQRFGRWTFVTVRGEQQGVPRKPDPTSALDVAKALGVPPADIGFVGDTAIDMKTARAAGMTPVGVLWGFRGRAELEGAGAWRIIERPEQLLALSR